MICAIHQPNFFPWLGYFDKINKSDVFVFLDNVNYPKSSKTMACYVNRVGIMINGEKRWISCPVMRKQGNQVISDVEILNENGWKDKLLKTLFFNYSKADYFDVVMPDIERIIKYNFKTLSEFNKNSIMEICHRIGIDSKFISQTDLVTEKHSTELLIEIVKEVGCDKYLCGKGAKNYQDDALFEKMNIDLIHQDYNHPIYNQENNDFVPGLSILDVMFRCGYEGTKQLIVSSND